MAEPVELENCVRPLILMAMLPSEVPSIVTPVSGTELTLGLRLPVESKVKLTPAFVHATCEPVAVESD